MVGLVFGLDAVYRKGILKLPRKAPSDDVVKLALLLLSRGEVSVGFASRIAGLDYRSFLEVMKKHKVHYPYDEGELERDLATSKELIGLNLYPSQKEKIDLALLLLSRGEVSVGFASRIAGLDYRSFLEVMKKHKVHYPYDRETFERELDKDASD